MPIKSSIAAELVVPIVPTTKNGINPLAISFSISSFTVSSQSEKLLSVGRAR